MSDIEKRAHDFAIAAVSAYQSVENQANSMNERKSKYELNALLDIYLEAYNALEVELCERQNH